MKGKAEARHATKENLTALRLIARQGAEKSQLEEWKADLLHSLTSEIAQIHKAHGDAMEAQREEMERQREQFQFEIEMLGGRIRDLEREKEISVHGQTQQKSRSVQKPGAPEKETIQAPREESTTPSSTYPVSSGGQRSYATVAASKPAQTPSQPWTKVSYGNRKNEAAKSPVVKVEQRGRRILFPRRNGGQLKSEADLMLALNEAL